MERITPSVCGLLGCLVVENSLILIVGIGAPLSVRTFFLLLGSGSCLNELRLYISAIAVSTLVIEQVLHL